MKDTTSWQHRAVLPYNIRSGLVKALAGAQSSPAKRKQIRQTYTRTELEHIAWEFEHAALPGPAALIRRIIAEGDDE